MMRADPVVRGIGRQVGQGARVRLLVILGRRRQVVHHLAKESAESLSHHSGNAVAYPYD